MTIGVRVAVSTDGGGQGGAVDHGVCSRGRPRRTSFWLVKDVVLGRVCFSGTGAETQLRPKCYLYSG